MTPLAMEGSGQPLSPLQRVRQHASKLKKVQGLSAIIETWFIDDLIACVDCGDIVLKDFYKEYSLNGGTIASYMTAARFFTPEERHAVDPERNLPMTLWKHAYEKSETENSDGLPKATVLSIISSFVEALTAGELWYEDDDSEGIETTVSNLKSHLSDAYDLLGLGVSVAREFYPAVEITPDQGNAACEAVGIDKRPVFDAAVYDHFVKMTFIRRRRK